MMIKHAKERNREAMNGKREKNCENENSQINSRKELQPKNFHALNTRAENFTILFCFALENFRNVP